MIDVSTVSTSQSVQMVLFRHARNVTTTVVLARSCGPTLGGRKFRHERNVLLVCVVWMELIYYGLELV